MSKAYGTYHGIRAGPRRFVGKRYSRGFRLARGHCYSAMGLWYTPSIYHLRIPLTRDPQPRDSSLHLVFFCCFLHFYRRFIHPTQPIYTIPSIMPTRRGGSLAPSSRRGGSGGIRRNTRNRQAPRRYGQTPVAEFGGSESEEIHDSESEDVEAETSGHGHSSLNTIQLHPPLNVNQGSISFLSSAPSNTSVRESSPQAALPGNDGISLDDMRQLLRSHEQDIVNRVVLQLRSQNPNLTQRSPPTEPPPVHVQASNSTANRVAELENQLAILQAERDLMQGTSLMPRELTGMYNLNQLPTPVATGSASAMVESVEMLFPAVERSTLTQIIENRFKPTNIYRLLATEKERAETQRTINIGGVECEQMERDGRESEYRMSGFFKAWAAYSGILVKLAPYALQGELATSLFIYTMSVYDLLEKYSWDGVKGYHFQFHRKRVASGKSIYLPQGWRNLDSELIASRCFAHPLQRSTWTQGPSRQGSYPRRITELPLRENPFPHGYLQQNPTPNLLSGVHDRRPTNLASLIQKDSATGNTGITSTTGQVCRNWNYRECRTTNCRHQHICIACGNNHKSVQCAQGATSLALLAPAHTSRYQGR